MLKVICQERDRRRPMTKLSLPGLIAAWTAAVAALGSSDASACQGPGWHGNIFFSEQGLPEVGGTVAAYVEIVNRSPSGGTVDNPRAQYAVVARVTKVVRGKIDQDYVTLDTPSSSCDHPPGAGAKGLIIGHATTDADSRIRITTLSESAYGFHGRINERVRACPMPRAADDALIIAYGTAWGEIYSPVSTVGLGNETRASRIVVEPGSRPIYAVLGSSGPLIWKIEGDTARIDRVILVTPHSSVSAFTSAVVGVPKDRIDYLTCLPIARGGLEEDTLAHVVRRELGRIDKIAAASSTYRVALPSLATADISSSPAEIPGFKSCSTSPRSTGSESRRSMTWLRESSASRRFSRTGGWLNWTTFRIRSRNGTPRSTRSQNLSRSFPPATAIRSTSWARASRFRRIPDGPAYSLRRQEGLRRNRPDTRAARSST
jgi:hypothetical protein